jgi:threonine/homoserine/homoserine lactone efflux protein
MTEPIIALILAAAVLAAIPGPNLAFIVASSLRHGFGYGAIVVAGTTAGVAIQLSLVVFGLAALLALAAGAMVWIKWLGVVYLLYLGVRAWRAPAENPAVEPGAGEGAASAFWQGLGLAVVNPKTLMFNAAFLPQFVPSGSAPGEVAPFALIYLAVLGSVDMMWAAAGGRARGFLRRFNALRHKLTGGFLIGAGIGLALARVQK